MPNEDESVRILDIIREEDVKGNIPKEFTSLPLYEVVEDGIIKLNYGIRSFPDQVLFYDVTNASEELKAAYTSVISEYEVVKIIDYGKPQRKEVQTGKIVTVLPVTGVYSILEKTKINELGFNFVTITATDSGIMVRPLLKKENTYPPNTYLSIDTLAIGEELFREISSDLIELTQKENGLFENRTSLSSHKEL